MREIEMLEKAKKEFKRINHVVTGVSDREKVYKGKLAGLKKELPELFAKMELNKSVTREEIDDIKDSIRLFKERIDEIPTILKGLEPFQLTAQHQIGKLIRQLETLYRSTKSKLSKGDKSPGLIEQLKACAPHVGMTEDAEEFLRRLEKAKTD